MEKINRKIVILPSGWVFVGIWQEVGNRVILTESATIRKWGTEYGLGELAIKGPRKETVLDPAGTVSFQLGSEIASLDCKTDNWK
jgi:hypothetical protein